MYLHSPPPNAIPQYCPILKNCGAYFIKQSLNNFVYVWTIFGNSFWMYLIDEKDDFLFSYAWDGSNWKYIKLSINLIDSFY